MFTLACRFRTTFVFAALASALVLADDAHQHRRLPHAHRHLAVNLTEPETHLEKRFDGARFTYFDVGTNACGSFDHDSDFIVALTALQWDGGSHCYDQITVSYNGKSAQAKITDECENCPYGAIDLSPGLFTHLTGSLDAGEVYGSWVYGSGAAPTTSTTPPPAPPTTTSTKHSTTSTSTKPTTTSPSTTSTQSTSTTVASSEASSTSTTSSSASSTTTSSSPTATATSWDSGTLNQLNLALIQLADLSNVILASPSDVQ